MAAGMGVQGGARDRGRARYRRRRPLPALILALVLCVVATVVWLRVMETSSEPTAAAHCTPPAGPAKDTTATVAPTTPGKALDYTALDRTTPAPPDKVLVRVVNASTHRGEARLVTGTLRQLGFTQVADPDNDALYGDSMSCRAQIRFGPQGTAAARTLSLLEPCAELIRDERTDATVDIAIGEEFDSLRVTAQTRALLDELAEWSAEHPEESGGLQANAPKPNLDKNLLTRAC